MENKSNIYRSKPEFIKEGFDPFDIKTLDNNQNRGEDYSEEINRILGLFSNDQNMQQYGDPRFALIQLTDNTIIGAITYDYDDKICVIPISNQPHSGGEASGGTFAVPGYTQNPLIYLKNRNTQNFTISFVQNFELGLRFINNLNWVFIKNGEPLRKQVTLDFQMLEDCTDLMLHMFDGYDDVSEYPLNCASLWDLLKYGELDLYWPDDIFIDLGLPSQILWCKVNNGAFSEEQYGLRYVWGNQLDGYGQPYLPSDENLRAGQDGGECYWGGSNVHSTPTEEQFEELVEYTTQEWVTINGVDGLKFTGTNGNYIFFPATGQQNSQDCCNDEGVSGYYWTTNYAQGGERAHSFIVNSYDGGYISYDQNRSDALSVRAVRKKPHAYKFMYGQDFYITDEKGTIFASTSGWDNTVAKAEGGQDWKFVTVRSIDNYGSLFNYMDVNIVVTDQEHEHGILRHNGVIYNINETVTPELEWHPDSPQP